MNRILVGYDGSEPARHALAQASRLAVLYSCPLTVFTAVDERAIRSDGVVTLAADEDAARRTAQEGAVRAREAGVLAAAARTSLAAPADALVRLAEEEGHDLVVVGHRGIGALKELFLGSTAKSVVDRVHRSVLVVR